MSASGPTPPVPPSTEEQFASDSPDAGENAAALFQVLYDELHRLAVRAMSRERRGHTLQPTALLHEVYLRLARSGQSGWSGTSRELFLAHASVVMRRILINHAAARGAVKRGDGRQRIDWTVVPPDALIDDKAAPAGNDQDVDLLALDAALIRLAELDATQARIVELRFFGGLTIEQCAALLSVSERTVSAEWAHARAWLRRQLQSADERAT